MAAQESSLGPLRALGAALVIAALAGCAAGPRPQTGGPPVELHRPPEAAAPVRLEPGEEPLDGPALRVLLRRGSQGLKVSAPGGLRLCSTAGATLARLPPRGRAGLSASGGRITMGRRSLGVADAIVLPLKGGETLRVGGRRYRGRLVLRAQNDKLALVDVVGLEDYLRGVLPSEVGEGPTEALKAQAVAARSFAVASMQGAAGRSWDLDNSADSQVYKGREEETAAADAAVAGTRGQILAWGRSVARAFFHSNSGGHTADAGEVWEGGQIPAYLLGVEDPWSESMPHDAWSTTLPREQVELLLERAGLWQGFLETVVGHALSDSGRWTRVDLVGHRGLRTTVTANDFRKALGPDRLRSTRFRVRQDGDSLVFEGHGWGHGVGMSQEGAFAMAKDGRQYRDILRFYYPGTRVATLRE